MTAAGGTQCKSSYLWQAVAPGVFAVLMHRLALILALTLAGPAIAAERIALVVGAESYQEYPLKTPASNVNTLANQLMGLGIDVGKSVNSPYRELKNLINRFGEQAADAELALFYPSVA